MAVALKDVVVVNDYTVIQVKVDEQSEAVHYIYFKEHDVPDTHPSKPSGRTLFVLNIPPYVDKLSLLSVFSGCGIIRHIFLQQKPSSGAPVNNNSTSLFQPGQPTVGYRVAYIVFKDKGGVSRAKVLPYSKVRYFSTAKHPLKTGLQKWRDRYISTLPPSAERLKSEVEKYMSEYDSKMEEEKQTAKETEGVPDEEGWVTVTKQSKNKAVARNEVQERRVKRKLKRQTREKELLHFYKFQIRESKKDHITQLRQKFEEDKRQIASMKAARKFRPY